MTWLKKRSGQSTVETAVLFTCVIGGLMFMAAYVQRATQGGMKGNADSIGQQFSTSKTFESVSVQHSLTDQTSTASGQCSESVQGLGETVTPDITDCSPSLPTAAPTTPPSLPN